MQQGIEQSVIDYFREIHYMRYYEMKSTKVYLFTTKRKVVMR